MTPDRLKELEAAGWHITRDGSTATARFNWDDPEDPEVAWELLVLHTSGHPNRFSLDAEGLSERSPADLALLTAALHSAAELLARWAGQLPDEAEA